MELLQHTDNMYYEILEDQLAISPREEENFGTLVVINNRYLSGDHDASREEIDSYLNNKEYISLPVYAYIHGGISLNTTGFSCPWDSGQIGCIFVSKKQVRNDFSIKRISSQLELKVKNYLKQEVEIYNNYLNGEVYGYIVKDDNNQELDSCFGFYSKEDAERAAQDSISYFANKVA